MVKKRIVDVLESQDKETKLWKTSFVAARMAYEEGKLKEAKSLITKSLHRSKKISNPHDKGFAEATSLLGQGAIFLAEGNLKEAKNHLDKALAKARTVRDNQFQEVYAICLRFYADYHAECKDYARAEDLLLESIQILEDIGTDAALFLADSLSDLCALYLMLERDKEIEDYIIPAVTIYRNVKGNEDIDYYRSVTLRTLASDETDEEEMEELVESTLTRSAYLVSLKHPHMQRFLKRYCRYLKDKGDTQKIDILHKEFKGAFTK